ncbi:MULTISPECIES: lactonase family protein [unclassified Gemella]|uniref:lactonase family protein n=1 Tax=unclassified Gemella TaxID=2624949 RepID=UPI001073D617|nr:MULTISPECIES: beta-propeller fold lactonase family protein [unclassified Gemella]MBF0709874.1 beta-propeller fold lactonase family protein [Gemella sp. GL1.1]MBF0746822.1 beta-propeller fold lactonase family protein [Gemella sp. 19428wG2_WT2a]NYS27218.1 beta-propeller fold lactonase family protein [Gemella sp. GL1]TFU59547.1 lactonase family protein [Gemella sp. WT2a]
MLEKFYLGSYTKRESKGLYSVVLDTEKKELLDLKIEKETNNPTYLDNKEKKLVMVSGKNGKGGILYTDNAIILESYTEDAVPCYVALNKDIILTANYHTASLIAYKVSDNKLEILDIVEHNEDKDEKKSHIHYSDWSKDKKYILACDLGKDTLLTYKLNNNKFELVSTYKTKKGAGPRHLTFHPTLDIAYLICELDASIEVLSYSKENGSFELIEKVNLLENESDKKWAAAIKLTKDGKFLYASNRGYDLILAYSILENARLKKLATYKTNGLVPRDFAISSNEKFLIVAHQDSDNLTLFERNNDGSLNLLNSDFYAPEIVCVKNKED